MIACRGRRLWEFESFFTCRCEREADTMAIELVGTSEPMMNALKRPAKDDLSNVHSRSLYVRFYYSHPPLLERIKFLKSLNET